MLHHLYHRLYILESEGSDRDQAALGEAGIQVVVSLADDPTAWTGEIALLNADLPLQEADLARLLAGMAEGIRAGQRVAVCCFREDRQPLALVIGHLVQAEQMSFSNAYVLLAERFYTITIDPALLFVVAQHCHLAYTKEQLSRRAFFFDLLAEVSSTPSPILPDLYVCSLAALGNLPATRALGIRAVLRLDEIEGRGDERWPDDFALLDLPICDGEPITPDTLRSGTAFIHAQIKTGHKVLVHCVGGVSRSVAFALAYLIEYRGLSLPEAYALIVSRRAVACPHEELFVSLVKHYHLPYALDAVRSPSFPERLLLEAASTFD